MGQALGGFGATIADKFSWQLSFQLFGLAGIIYCVILIIFLKDRYKVAESSTIHDSKKPSLFKGLAILIPSFSFWLIFFYFSIPSLPGWGIKNWLPTLFSHNLHIDMATAGPLSTITIATSSLLGVIVGGNLADR